MTQKALKGTDRGSDFVRQILYRDNMTSGEHEADQFVSLSLQKRQRLITVKGHLLAPVLRRI